VFSCFVDPGRVSAYTQSAADISDDIGKKFSLMHGCITGSNVDVVRDEKIVQKWRLKDWPEDAFSSVTILFAQVNDSTARVTVSQSNIPLVDSHGNEGVIAQTKAGWTSNFFDRIKMVFGFGAPSGVGSL